MRNAVMGRPVNDIDIATQLTPDEVTVALQAAGVKALPVGIAHGTVMALVYGQSFEITTLRQDVRTDGRHAEVRFTTDWQEDSRRRDFRLNAIYAEPGGRLHDPQGGVADALAGRIVFIGEARQRIMEDYLRILRFYRFHAWYGSSALDEDGQAACVELKDGLASLSAERVWKELKALLAAPDPGPALEAMAEAAILERILPTPVDYDLALKLIALGRTETRAADPLLRAAALVGARGEEVVLLAKAMKVSKVDRRRLIEACAPHKPRPGADPASRRRTLYRIGPQAYADQLLLAAASWGETGPALKNDLARIHVYVRPYFPVSASDLIAQGVEEGRALGAALARLEKAWIDSDFTLKKEGLLALA